MIADLIKVLEYLESRKGAISSASRLGRQESADYLRKVGELLEELGRESTDPLRPISIRSELLELLGDPPEPLIQALPSQKLALLLDDLVQLVEGEVQPAELYEAGGRLKGVASKLSLSNSDRRNLVTSRQLLLGALTVVVVALAVYAIILF